MGLIGLLMAMGIVLFGCDALKKECPGNGECTVTIDQGSSGLYVDNNSPRSSCGRERTYDYNKSEWVAGCRVEDNIDNYNRTFGVKSCNCAK